MIIKTTIILKVLLLFLGGFLNNCFADEPTIDSIVMNNTITVSSGSSVEESTIKVLANENVYLTGTYSNCDIAYSEPTIKWFKNNFVMAEEIGIGDSITIQTAYSGSYFATLYCKGIPLNSLSFNIEIQSKKSGGGRSHYSRMLDEANLLFSSSGNIDNINLKLNLSKENYSPFLYFTWNNIGGDGHINYILEYSTGSDFSTFILNETRERFYNLYEQMLDYDSFIHYFRVKACYLDKCSDYSDIVKYYSEDYLKISCKKDIETIDYSDVFDYDNSFIDDYFKVKCTKCNIKQKQENNENILLDQNYKTICTKCNLSSYQNENNYFLDNYNVKCKNCKKIKY